MIIKSNMFSEEEQARYEDMAHNFYQQTYGKGPEHIMTSLLTYQVIYLSAMLEKISDQIEEVYLMMEDYDRSLPEAAEVLDLATRKLECTHSLLNDVDHKAM
jgi:hypothetical protein